MTKYSLYTERKLFGKRKLTRILNASLAGYTLFKTIGYWKGRPESAWKIEVILDSEQWYLIKLIAFDIKRALNQESVLITSETLDRSDFI